MSHAIPADVIIPPLDIRDIIHKVSSYVSKNGDSFELKMKSQEANNPEFGFLYEKDPYNRYYTWVLQELRAGNEGILELFSLVPQENTDIGAELSLEDFAEPKAFTFILRNLPPISRIDISILKMTALFVAVNGEPYIDIIKTQRNATGQYDFLNDTHSFHKIFRLFVQQYRKVVRDTTDSEVNGLLSASRDELLLHAFQRAEYNYVKETTSKQAMEALEFEKLEFSRIDWNDFSVVETIEFSEIDYINELPPPLSLDDLRYRSLESKKRGVTTQESIKEEDEAGPEAEPEAELEVLAREVPKPKAHAKPKGMKIKSAGETRLKRASPATDQLLECPLTHQMIPDSQFQQHIAILLRDPKYKQERENFERKHHTYGSNLSTDVYANIQRLAKREAVEDETRKRSKRNVVQWDGYSGTMDSVKEVAAGMYSEKEVEEMRRKRQEEENKIGPRK
ncbi:hypothetical protein BABINDRAFT_162686 [Babjeviella inositovora NRRL Y-12698]|uniref:SURP motif domain-containing protein n=1 Tax=Babjeviella inositovora NRRL Y-12698 TaxID=984486 RepID=A0A1E3QLA7_9ASCO|nr:uncharacterized protein BABINDRAFT_162686 [Babjeviella inositovora NRRL Y-12698]ODQ78471.1 hypothetical protein BABINDRAFT_162686 [Babjeviella inositovora NRRL Y-12698]